MDPQKEKEMKFEKDATTEEERLRRLLFSCGVSRERVDSLGTVIENTAWMKLKLEETRELIGNTAVAINYDNGGGQKGIRENPLYKGYSALWKSYMAGLNTIFSVLPQREAEKEAENIDTPKTVLQLVRAKHVKQA